jgi:hypothetical protein
VPTAEVVRLGQLSSRFNSRAWVRDCGCGRGRLVGDVFILLATINHGMTRRRHGTRSLECRGFFPEGEARRGGRGGVGGVQGSSVGCPATTAAAGTRNMAAGTPRRLPHHMLIVDDEL